MIRVVTGWGATRQRTPSKAAGQREQQLALFAGQAQRPGQRFQHLGGRRGDPPLFQAGHVVDGDAGQLGELFPAKTRRAPGA